MSNWLRQEDIIEDFMQGLPPYFIPKESAVREGRRRISNHNHWGRKYPWFSGEILAGKGSRPTLLREGNCIVRGAEKSRTTGKKEVSSTLWDWLGGAARTPRILVCDWDGGKKTLPWQGCSKSMDLRIVARCSYLQSAPIVLRGNLLICKWVHG